MNKTSLSGGRHRRYEKEGITLFFKGDPCLKPSRAREGNHCASEDFFFFSSVNPAFVFLVLVLYFTFVEQCWPSAASESPAVGKDI